MHAEISPEILPRIFLANPSMISLRIPLVTPLEIFIRMLSAGIRGGRPRRVTREISREVPG